MAKYSNSTPKRKSVFAPVTTSAEATERTFNGAAGYLRSPEGEAFLLASGGFLGGEKTFYEGGDERDERFRLLIRELSVTNPDWVAKFLFWLRREGNIRTAAIMGAAEYVWARRDEMGTGRTGTTHPTPASSTRSVVASVLVRADEPQEMIGYWMSRYGRSIPKPMKRGVSDAMQRLYTEFGILKYDSEKRGLRMADAIQLVHAEPLASLQSNLYKYLLNERFGAEYENKNSLPLISARDRLMRIPVSERRSLLLANSDVLRNAGMTWESVAGWIQRPMDGKVWEAVIPQMGYMALLRNLRNFVQAGVSESTLEDVDARLTDAVEVRRSKQFPFRFLSAYNANSGNVIWGYPLEKALNMSLENVPALPGRSLILVDRSGSMGHPMSFHSDMNLGDGAAVFGSALALRAERADLVQFGTTYQAIPFHKSDSLLKVIDRFENMGGTDTTLAIKGSLRGDHARVIIVTDEQTSPGYINQGYGYAAKEISVNDLVPATIPFYMWNFGGYKASAMRNAGSENCYNFGGLSDSSFRLISLIEAGSNAGWPWEQTSNEI